MSYNFQITLIWAHKKRNATVLITYLNPCWWTGLVNCDYYEQDDDDNDNVRRFHYG